MWEDEEDEEMEINHAALEKEAQEFAESFNASQTTSLVDLWDTEGSEMLFTTEESPSAENEIGTQTQSGKRGRKRIDRGIGRPKDSSIPLEALPKVKQFAFPYSSYLTMSHWSHLTEGLFTTVWAL